MHEKVTKTMFDIFWKGVQSVQIPRLMNENIHYNVKKDVLKIFNFDYNLQDKKVYVVGAGKAVYYMATEIESMLGSKLLYGIVSIPLGTIKKGIKNSNSIIKFYEGAENNLPDERAQSVTKKIINFVSELDETSLLLVLLSGGGSALLTSPIPPITLDEKCQLINNLARTGADIIELNTVRKQLSLIKGGKLSHLAYPASIISLLVSDIVKNRADFISSGPTFPNDENSEAAINVIKKYSLEKKLPTSIMEVLNNNIKNIPNSNLNVENFILGNNTMAIDEAKATAFEMGYLTFVISDCIQGDVNEISKQYCELVNLIFLYLSGNLEKNDFKTLLKKNNPISLTDTFIEEIMTLDLNDGYKGLCLIGGGEPTVTVEGRGKGGRSQQLSLAFSMDIHNKIQHSTLSEYYDVYILCAGTDGIDGPTDAAGAIGYSQLINDANKENLDVKMYLNNNDSYNFYNKFSNGKFHVKTGHTNTNVMDLHVIFFEPKISNN